jgi:hypothetical protein
VRVAAQGQLAPVIFGPGAVVQTFDALTENYFGTYGPLVLDGVTYSTSLPDMYRIPSGSDCFSGSCFGIHVQGAWFTITLDNPAERIGGYLLALLWQNLAIDRRYWIPESGFQ